MKQIVGRCIGYARVSTQEQELALQIDALINAICNEDSIFIDKASGAKSSRPGLDDFLKALKLGDTLMVWRLGRLDRSMQHLVTLVEELRQRGEGVGFKSICDGT